MLVLTRKEGEKIHIGKDIVLTVLEVKGNRIRIGVEAPSNLSVLRGELVVDAQSGSPVANPADKPVSNPTTLVLGGAHQNN
jgi:carbon storage regulator